MTDAGLSVFKLQRPLNMDPGEETWPVLVYNQGRGSVFFYPMTPAEVDNLFGTRLKLYARGWQQQVRDASPGTYRLNIVSIVPSKDEPSW